LERGDHASLTNAGIHSSKKFNYFTARDYCGTMARVRRETS